jgi:hypothetical protein
VNCTYIADCVPDEFLAPPDLHLVCYQCFASSI